jgi:hypothetical protein
MKKEFLGYQEFINEGGNAFKNLKRFESDKKMKIFERVTEIMEQELKYDLSEYSIVGSFNSKTEEIGDIDIALYPEKSFKFSTLDDTYNNIEKLSNKVGNLKHLKIEEERISKTLGVLSLSTKIEKRNFQIDLIPVPSKKWGEWSYHSPDPDKSTYKGLYRNALLEAIAKSLHFDLEYYEQNEETKYFKEGEIKSYMRYRYLRNAGLWKVREKNEGTRVFRYEKIKDTYAPVSHDPEKVINILLGKKNFKKYMTFESVLNVISSKSWSNYELLPTILENFRIIIEDRQGNEIPSIVQNLMEE